MPQRGDMHLVRPPGKWRYERDPVLVAQNCALPSALSHEHIAVDAASGLSFVPRAGSQLVLQHRRDEGIGVDLAVRMAERDTDRLAAVFEDVDVADVWQPAQLLGAVA